MLRHVSLLLWVAACGAASSELSRNGAPKVDADLFSRQIYTMGVSAQERLTRSKVLVIGLGGCGLELCKNLVLSGVSSLLLCDESAICDEDLETLYYGTTEDVDLGSSRADVVKRALERLAPAKTCRIEQLALRGNLEKVLESEEVDVVVLCDRPTGHALRVNELTRRKGVNLVTVNTRGVFGGLFCDFGDSFTVQDKDAKPAKAELLARVEVVQTNSGKALLVRTLEDNPHGLHSGDRVRLRGVQGIGDSVIFTVKAKTPQAFECHNAIFASSITKDSGRVQTLPGATFLEIKEPVVVKYQPLKEALLAPDMVATDFGKLDLNRQITLHACFHHGYRRGQSAGKEEASDAETLFDAAKSFGENVYAFLSARKAKSRFKPDSKLVRAFASSEETQILPIATIMGALAAQEALKAITGVFVPVRQFLYFDALELHELLPQNGDKTLLSAEFKQRLQSMNVFVVGAGAIGCELLKILAALGVSSTSESIGEDRSGKLCVTDMDTVEVSNLSRQMLFTEDDVGKPKATAAVSASQGINPQLQAKAFTKKLAAETEDIFDHKFWQKQSLVLNALDNLEARRYVDQQCVRHGIPLIDSGTLGAKGSTQPCVPRISETYSNGADDAPDKDQIALCTIHSFPTRVEHVVQWAKDIVFQSEFVDKPARVRELAEAAASDAVKTPSMDDEEPAAELLGELRLLVDLKTKAQSADGRAAVLVEWASKLYRDLYIDAVEAIFKQHPLDEVDEDGEKFWSNDRLLPRHLVQVDDLPLFEAFLVSAAMLKARALRVECSEASIESAAAQAAPQRLAALRSNQGRAGPSPESAVTYERVLDTARSLTEVLDVDPQSFEKDDDSNGHVKFITAAGNCRAAVYGISQSDMLEVRRIAGAIVPAMVTTTALVAGLAVLEMLKVVAGANSLTTYRSAFLNLAVPMMSLTEPESPESYGAPTLSPWKQGSWVKHTSWDFIDVSPQDLLTDWTVYLPRSMRSWISKFFISPEDAQLSQLATALEARLNVKILGIAHGDQLAYFEEMTGMDLDSSSSDDSKALSGHTKLMDIARRSCPGGAEDSWRDHMSFVDLELICEDKKTGDELSLPAVRYFLSEELRKEALALEEQRRFSRLSFVKHGGSAADFTSSGGLAEYRLFQVAKKWTRRVANRLLTRFGLKRRKPLAEVLRNAAKE